MKAARVAANAGAGLLLAVATFVALSLVYASAGLGALLVALLAVPLWLGLPRGLPGRTLRSSLREIAGRPLVRGNPRLAILATLDALLVLAFWAGAFWPALQPEIGRERLRVETLHDDEPFDLELAPDGRLLAATFASYAREPGLLLLDPGHPGERSFTPLPEAFAHFVTVLPERARVLVHTPSYPDPERVPVSRTRVLALDGARVVGVEERQERWLPDLFRSRLAPERDELLVVQKGRREQLWILFVDDYLAGDRAEQARTIYLGAVPGFEDVTPGWRDGRVVARGESTRRVKDVELATGDTRATEPYAFVMPPVTRDVVADAHGVWLLRGLSHAVARLDTGSWRVSRERFVGGLPTAGAHLASEGLLAVGLYHGRRLLLLDDRDLSPRVRLETCPRVRSVVWSETRRELYFGDACGLHRLGFAEPTPASARSSGADPTASGSSSSDPASGSRPPRRPATPG